MKESLWDDMTAVQKMAGQDILRHQLDSPRGFEAKQAGYNPKGHVKQTAA